MIKILMLEDNKYDLGLILNQLKKDQLIFTYKKTDNKEGFTNLLDSFCPDILLADYRLPGFTGLEALEIVKQTNDNLPVIFVSGTIGEEKAVKAMKNGLSDYILKDNLSRLSAAIRREIKEAEIRRKHKEAQELLRINESTLKKTQEVAHLGSCEVDLTTGICECSQEFYNILGLQPGRFDIKLKNIIQLINPSERKIFENAIRETTLTNKNFDIIINFNCPDKKLKIIHCFGELRDKENNKNNRIILAAHDITELIETKKALENVEKEKSMILDSTSELFLFYNENLKIKWANNAVSNYLNIEQSEYRNKFCYEVLLDRKEPCNECPVLKALSTRQVHYHILLTPDDKIWEVKGFPVLDNDGEIIGLGEVARDITAQKKAEDELIKAKEKAEGSDRLKSAFLANMSHEIRTPMNGILGFTEMLNKEDLSGEEKKYYSEIIKDSTNRLLHIVNDILDLSRIEAQQLKIEKNPFDINKLMKELYYEFEMFKNKNNKSAVELRLKNKHSEGCYIYSDKHRIRQVLTNLLNNAFKFTEQGYVEFGYKVKDSGTIQFRVKDTGIGISREFQGIIFERFRQADDSMSRSYGGAGLGLCIAEGLVRLLGGKIWINSTPGIGSTFFFTISHDMEEETKLIEKTLSEPDNIFKDNTILVVEDEELNILYYKELFKNSEINSLFARDAKEAIQKVTNNSNIDMVLMDIKLPGENGYKATKKIKKIRKELPVIAQTAYAYNEDRLKCLKAGCDDYIAKPVKKGDLFELMKKHLKKRDSAHVSEEGQPPFGYSPQNMGAAPLS
jgi:signal transduction histidine kinase/DNA-binding response OmpR family regulator